MNIREATVQDQDNIIKFIKDYWDENHIFVRSPELFKYQYQSGNQIHFILGIDNNEIVSILGYIPYSKEVEYQDVFLAMWMTSPHVKSGNVGLLLNKYLLDQGYRSVSCCGIAKKVKGLYKFLGYTTGALEHYYMLNNNKNTFSIAEVNNKVECKIESHNQAELVKIETFNDLLNRFNFEFNKNQYFYKDQEYMKHRYFEHPFYQYQVYGIKKEEQITSLLITREILMNQSKVLRVMDFIGKDLDISGVGLGIKQILVENDYEYIDFYQYGISEEILNYAGFIKREKEDTNIIPNYFEPFEQKNVDILFATNVMNSGYWIFKGDGDQDRPNLLPGELQ